MPIIVEFTYADGTTEVVKIPAQIWRKDESKVNKVFTTDKEVVSIRIDPNKETADINENNNTWPQVDAPSKFAIYKTKKLGRGTSEGENPMKKAQQRK
jgi:hypothetical protein